MEYVRLDPQLHLEYSNPLFISQDSAGSVELAASTLLWTQNAAAASQIWPIEFLAAQTKIHVIDVTKRGAGKVLYTIDALSAPLGFNDMPRGVTYLHVTKFLGREVLLATTDEGNIFIWRTLALYQNQKQPWFHYKVQESAWGIDTHLQLPLIVISDNSQRITLLELQGFETLEVRSVKTSDEMGGNIPCVCFLASGFIGYTMLTVDLLAGSFGVLNCDLEVVYSTKMQQAGWCIRGISESAFVNVSNGIDLCGTPAVASEFEPTECHDTCNASYILDIEPDRLGFVARWVDPQTWVKDQQRQVKEWIRHGRRKSLYHEEKLLKHMYLFVTTSSHAFLVAAGTGICMATAQKAILPPGVMPSEEFTSLALSIVEIIEPLNLAIVVSRAAFVCLVRFTRQHGILSFRQECVLCDFNDFIVGLSVRPAHAHDFDYDLEKITIPEQLRRQDVPDCSLGNVGVYLVRIHGQNGKVESFLLSAEEN